LRDSHSIYASLSVVDLETEMTKDGPGSLKCARIVVNDEDRKPGRVVEPTTRAEVKAWP